MNLGQLDDRTFEQAQPPAPGSERAPVEIGWVLAGRVDRVTREAAHASLQKVRGELSRWLPEFDWRLSLTQRAEGHVGIPAEPMELLDIGVLERDVACWDFALVISEAPLQSHDKPFMLGAPSQAVDVAVLSTARLDLGSLDGRGHAARVEALARRLSALAMHLFGHLNDLGHSEDAEDFMFDLKGESQLDRMTRLSDDAVRRLRSRLKEVADLRVEEREDVPRVTRFYLAAMWPNRFEILAGIRRVSPWAFPFRYSRLTTASVSTLLVLLVTAEAWELGMGQPGWRVVGLSALTLLGTTYYVLARQRLLNRFGHRLSEQSVVARVSVTVGVLLGMLTTYALLFAATWLGARLFFGPQLVHNWTPSIPSIDHTHYLALAGFVASLGISVGALGASFEEQSYFRRVTLLDEET